MRRRLAVAAIAALLATLAGCTATARLRPIVAPPPPGLPRDVPTPGQNDDAGRSEPVADPLYPAYGNPSLDVLRYRLNLGWSPPRLELYGTATLTIRAVVALTELALDFSDTYTVEATTVDGRPVSSVRRGNDLVVAATVPRDGRTTLVVTYHGTPHAVPMPSRRTDFPGGIGLRPGTAGEAWTMQEPYGASTWYPANDQPSDEALYDVAVTVPAGWTAIAHGQLMALEHGGTGDTYRWRSTDPVASYAATLALGRYTRVADMGPHGLPLTYWVRTGQDESLLPALRRTPASLTWLERHFGPYPFSTAGVVVVGSETAMETSQMVTYGARLTRAGSRLDTAEEILLHEFAHQWFGNAVTPTTWAGLWLNEGFAMYAEWLWSAEEGRQSEAEWEAWAHATDRATRSAGPPAQPDPTHFGESNVYVRPALMLHEIHAAIGDEAFFSLARDWVASHRNQSVDRATFVAFVNAHTAHDFTALIARWLDTSA
jgi:aminopeptidase N